MRDSQRLSRALIAAALVGAVLQCAATLHDLGGLAETIDRWYAPLVPILGGAALCLRGTAAGRGRRAWTLIGIALISWGAADTWYSIAFWNLDEVPFPSIADAFWLLFYPLAMAGVAALAATQTRGDRTGLSLLDGLIGALAIGSVGAAVLFGPIVEATGGSTLAIATNLAYPLGDLALIALVVGVMPFLGWQLGRAWILLTLGIVVFGISDSAYLVRIAEGTYTTGTILDAGWVVGAALMAFAGWQKPARVAVERRTATAWVVFVFPVTFGALAVAVLVYDHFARIHVLALVLAAACLLAVLGRMTAIFRENLSMIVRSQVEATTDSLTGLANRRRLVADLEQIADEATLLLLDLDGFKSYNDTFGHLAGDALLERLGTALSRSLDGRATAYRMGGDEFCVLSRREPDSFGLAAVAAGALRESGDGFEITSSYGIVSLPDEAADTTAALRLADSRMYAQKQQRRSSAGSQSKNVLLRALQERSPTLVDHVSDVADLAVETGRQLGLADSDLVFLSHVAELHDIGKVAIPDAILEKQGPLLPSEWAFVRQHTLIGERIIGAAPALLPVARAVRSTHERWDGLGYPDGLSGDEIPLVSRIVTACDALAAMLSERPYHGAVGLPLALDELDRCAGTQFDRRVVESIRLVLTRSSELAA